MNWKKKIRNQANTISNQNNTIRNQNSKIRSQDNTIFRLKSTVYRQKRKTDKFIENLAECHVPDTEGLSPETPRRIPHDFTFRLSCSQSVPRGVVERSCLFGRFQPGFASHPFSCGKGKSCKEIKDSDPSAATGTYEVEVDGHRIQLVCDMDISGGGWAVFQNRYNGETDFARNWTSYEEGFGQLDAEFWLGLRNINILTKEGSHQLRVEMESYDGRNKYAEYNDFRVSDSSDNYRLSFDDESYSGNAGNSLHYNNNEEFSTYDVDNDGDSYVNCATKHNGYGGNWYYACTYQNFNGKFGQVGDENNEFMFWYHF